MILTRENIHAVATKSGGFTARQLTALGVPWPPLKGWLTALIGRQVTDAFYDELVALGERGANRVKGRPFCGRKRLRDSETPDMFAPAAAPTTLSQSAEDYANAMFAADRAAFD